MVHLQKAKEKKEQFITDFIYRNELDKACFQHMAYGKSKHLAKRTQSDKVLKMQVIQNMMVIKEDKHQWFTSFLINNLVEVALPFRLQMNMLLNQIINLQMNFTSRLLENLRNENFIHCLETIFGVLI